MSAISYDKILSSMKTVFFNETGKSVDDISDIGVRFQAVASELYSISCYADYVLRQAFPQTATGTYLDDHAALRSIFRHQASKAVGELTFLLNEPTESAIEIPAGTVCSLKDEPYIQFVTTEAVTILSGELTAHAPAEALQTGSAHNVKAGEISVIVNPPAGVSGVTNNSAFVGGMELENDYSLRKRILSSFSVPLTGFNFESFRQVLLKNEKIIDCSVSKNGNELKVCVKLRMGSIDEELLSEISNSLCMAELGGSQISVIEAMPEDYSLTVKVSSTDGEEQLLTDVRNEIVKYTDAVKIGEELDLLLLAQVVAKLDGVDSCLISSPNSTNAVIHSDNTKYLRLKDLQVNYNE